MPKTEDIQAAIMQVPIQPVTVVVRVIGEAAHQPSHIPEEAPQKNNAD